MECFQFTLTRSTTDISKGPLFTGYQIKALPAIPRQRLIQYPLSCFDHESDHFGVEIGYEGSAYFNATPKGAWGFNLLTMDVEFAEQKNLPATTEFENKEKVTKIVGYLPIEKGFKLWS